MTHPQEPRSRRCSPLALALLAAGTVLGSAATALASPPSLAGAPETPPAPTSAPPWDSGQPAPPGYHVERKINRGLVIGGSVVFGAAYLGIVIPGLIIAVNGSPPAAVVTVPVGGPFYFVVETLRASNGIPLIAGLTAFDAVVQAGGAGMLIAGLVGKRILVPGPPRRSAVHLTPVPLRFGNNGAGLGIAGTF